MLQCVQAMGTLRMFNVLKFLMESLYFVLRGPSQPLNFCGTINPAFYPVSFGTLTID